MVARYNPCGAPVEIGRRPYTTRALLYPDTQEEFEIVWFPARDDVPFKRGPNAVNSLEWCRDRDEWKPVTVGEVWGAPRQFVNERVKQLAVGGHVCGSEEDFAGEGKFDGEEPFVEYRPDGLPECCGALNEGDGGLALSGVATVYTLGPFIDPTAGGMEIGGRAGDLITYVDPTEGGMEIGGRAGAVTEFIDPTEGGMEVGGEAGDALTYTDATAGGMEVGGEAGDVFTPPTPTPGTTCATAPTLTVGTTYNFTTAAGVGSQQWVKWVIATVPRTFNPNPVTGPTRGVFVYGGTSCAALGPGTSLTTQPFVYAPTGTNNVWLQFINTVGGAHAWSVKLT